MDAIPTSGTALTGPPDETAMATILIPLPTSDFDPTETGVPWRVLNAWEHKIVFATPNGREGQADPRMVTGQGLGPLAPLLKADANGLRAYQEMVQSPAFKQPIAYGDIRTEDFDALILPGGHAPGMKVYLESTMLQARVVEFFEQRKPVGAICHGTVLAARSRRPDGKSVLFGRKTTALIKQMEMSAWLLTFAWLGNYYRTYPQSVEDEVRAALENDSDFQRGPLGLFRDTPKQLERGFVVQDGHYLSARWPGDAHKFATEFAKML